MFRRNRKFCIDYTEFRTVTIRNNENMNFRYNERQYNGLTSRPLHEPHCTEESTIEKHVLLFNGPAATFPVSIPTITATSMSNAGQSSPSPTPSSSSLLPMSASSRLALLNWPINNETSGTEGLPTDQLLFHHLPYTTISIANRIPYHHHYIIRFTGRHCTCSFTSCNFPSLARCVPIPTQS